MCQLHLERVNNQTVAFWQRRQSGVPRCPQTSHLFATNITKNSWQSTSTGPIPSLLTLLMSSAIHKHQRKKTQPAETTLSYTHTHTTVALKHAVLQAGDAQLNAPEIQSPTVVLCCPTSNHPWPEARRK